MDDTVPRYRPTQETPNQQQNGVPLVSSGNTRPYTLITFVLLVGIMIGSAYLAQAKPPAAETAVLPTITPTPTPDLPFGMYAAPDIATKSAYTIVMAGDSMTAALGPHGGTFSSLMNDMYKKHGAGIIIDNYASGGKNVLDLTGMMTTFTTFWDAEFEPLLSREFDLILIESFGYNPLSQFPLEEGLDKQRQALSDAMKTITRTHPGARVAFVATISPNRKHYAWKVHPDSTPEERALQAEERIVYIQNHITYARDHGIPVIDIFEKSLDSGGDGNLRYINPDDYIHPSFAGVDFIGQELTEFIYENRILPHE